MRVDSPEGSVAVTVVRLGQSRLVSQTTMVPEEGRDADNNNEGEGQAKEVRDVFCCFLRSF